MAVADAVIAPCWLGVNLLLGSTAWKWGRTLFSQEGALQTALHTLVLCWACIVSSAVLLGVFGVLNGYALLSLVAGLAFGLRLALRFIAKKEGQPAPLAGGKVDLACGLLWWAVFAFWAGHVITDGLSIFPNDWDTLMYHLPLVDHWLQARSLYAPASAFWFSPGNNEVVAFWMVAPFSGDFLHALNNLPAAIIFSLATLELARNLGIAQGWSHLAALAVVSQFILFKQLVENENDLAVAAAFMATLAYGSRYWRSAQAADLALAAVALGLLAGIKYYALGYAAVAGGMIVLASLLSRKLRGAMRPAIALSIGFSLFGGYWYARNWWVSNSPIYPKGLNAWHDPMGERYPDMWQSTLLGNNSPEVLPLLVQAVRDMAGPCHVVAFVSIPGTLAWLIVSGFWDRRRWFLVGTLAGAGLVLASTPFAAEIEPGTLDMLRGHYLPVRFGLCFLSLSILAMVSLLNDVAQALRFLKDCGIIAGKSRWAAWGVLIVAMIPVVVFAVAIGTQFLTAMKRTQTLESRIGLPFCGATLLLWGMVLFAIWHSWPRWRGPLAGIVVNVCLGGAILSTGFLSDHWHRDFARNYDGLFRGKIFREAEKQGSRELRWCVIDYRPYPFFGSRRQFWVCQPLYLSSYSTLLRYLSEEEVNFVAVTVNDPFAGGRYQGVHDWFLGHPEDFVKRTADPWISVFQRKADVPEISKKRKKRVDFQNEAAKIRRKRIRVQLLGKQREGGSPNQSEATTAIVSRLKARHREARGSSAMRSEVAHLEDGLPQENAQAPIPGSPPNMRGSRVSSYIKHHLWTFMFSLLLLAGLTSYGVSRFGSFGGLIAAIQGRILYVDPRDIYVGSLKARDQKTVTVCVRNLANRPIRVLGSRSQPECGCLVTDELPLDLVPNEVRELRIHFTAPGDGRANFEFAVTFYVNVAGDQPQLVLHGSIVSADAERDRPETPGR